MSDNMTSSKPYIVRAFYDWISDNHLTPYIVVDCSLPGVMVPPAFVTDGQIVLNISGGAVGAISMAGDAIEFSARFGGKLEHLVVPYAAIAAIYAKENGAGTSLPVEHVEEDNMSIDEDIELASSETSDDLPEAPRPPKGKPSLKVIK